MSLWVAIALAVMALALGGLIGWAIRVAHSPEHQRTFTPICPNCGNEIRATVMLDPNPKDRLRDHFKECVS